jgi:hypothetical protein
MKVLSINEGIFDYQGCCSYQLMEGVLILITFGAHAVSDFSRPISIK